MKYEVGVWVDEGREYKYKIGVMGVAMPSPWWLFDCAGAGTTPCFKAEHGVLRFFGFQLRECIAGPD
jgi:hypothetical protein